MDPVSAFLAEEALRRGHRLGKKLLLALLAIAPLLGVFLLLLVAALGGAASDDDARRGADQLCNQLGSAEGATGSPSRSSSPAPRSRAAAPAVMLASPSPSSPPSSRAAQQPTISGAPLTSEQHSVARTIIAAGHELGVPQQGLVVALMTATQESQLKNLSGGDRDSVGVFQQRPSQGWGTVQQLQDVHYAATKFYKALLGTTGWQQMSLNDAAQAVQHSGFPDAYGQWQTLAVQLVSADGGSGGGDDTISTTCNLPGDDGSGSGPAPTGTVAAILAALKSKLGTPYAWGGGTVTGPSEGFAQGAGIIGWDCSSFMQMGVYQGTGGKVTLPRTAAAQGAAFLKDAVPVSQMQPGDLIFEEGSSPADAGHVAMAVGGGKMIEEPHTGAVARIRPIDAGGVVGVIRLPLAKLMG